MFTKFKFFTYLVAVALFTQFTPKAWSQQTICLGTDATLCAGSSINIDDCGGFGTGPLITPTPYVEELIPYNPDSFTTGTAIHLSDDAVSGALPIGFNFCFFGNDYTQFYIGSNGWISFSSGQSTSFTSATIPNTGITVPKNCIMGPWQDWHPGTGPNVGNYIRYQTLGTAPNRRLVVSWNQVPFFSCTTTYGTFQIIIFETTNYIETHIQNKPNCLTWAGGTATHGVHNIDGTVAFTVPGRNSTQWTVTNEARRFSPGLQVEWANTLGQTFPYNSGILNITNVQAGTVGYFLQEVGSSCASVAGTPSDTSWITGVQTSVNASMTPDICSAGMGTVTANPTQGTPPFQYNWPSLGANTQTVNGVSAGTYTVNVTDSYGCSASANITVTDTPAQYTSSSTLVSCPGGNDGTATANMVPLIGNVTYQWDDPMAQTTSTAVGLMAGTYNCTISSDVGCQSVVTVTVTEIPGMIGNVISQSDATCNSGFDGTMEVSVIQGTPPYSYSWDNSTSVTNSATDLGAGVHNCTVTDANGCVIVVTGTIGEPPALVIDFLTPDTQICPEHDILLSVTGSGGSSPYTFTWFENGVEIGTGTEITVDPENTNTEYCVVLSEECGSPEAQDCNLIYFPTPIVPNAVPDEPEKCVPGFFEFTNTSSNGGEIASTVWDFGASNLYLFENGNDSTSMLFNEVGVYDLAMTITSIYGCVYHDTIHNIIEVLPTPTANFNISNNPATIFETTVFMQDKSSGDVVQWEWYSPYSYPSSSNVQAPTFSFPEGETGVYPITLAVETERGCVDTITIDFHVVEDILFYAPNTFTPDGDEHNQLWNIHVAGIDIYDFDLFVFNRWGELIWESHDPSVGWDGTYSGKEVPTGMYVWVARVNRLNNDEKQEFHGTINVLR